MPRKGTTEDIARKRADKKQRAHQVKYGMTQTVQPKYKLCQFCGRTIMVNNYADGKSRTPRWRNSGLIICPWCNPANYRDKVVKPNLYKTIMSRVLVEKLAAKNFCFLQMGEPLEGVDCKCLGCASRKLVAIVGEEGRVKI